MALTDGEQNTSLFAGVSHCGAHSIWTLANSSKRASQHLQVHDIELIGKSAETTCPRAVLLSCMMQHLLDLTRA
jgi:hypothetical protein